MSKWLVRSAKISVIVLAAAAAAIMLLPGGTFLAAASDGHPATLSGAAPLAAPARPAETTTISAPSSAAAASSPSPQMLSSLPASLAKVPWIASLAHTGPSLTPLTSLPNVGLLTGAVPKSSQGTIDPFYVAQPDPIGLTDFGLGATPYSYNVSHLMGQVTLNAAPNVTDPGSGNVIMPAATHLGYVGSVYEFGVQLNTVATNISIPGSDQGFFWTQNVVNWNDTGIHFVDDTFNLTSATQSPFYLQPGTIYSACNNNSAGVDRILYVYGGVFQCVGGTIPLTAASYPITLQLYNNASVNSHDRTVVSYGYHITMWGTNQVYSGVSDMVVFNSDTPGVKPVNKPGFSIDAFAGAPSGLFRDAEIDLVGDIGGDNSVFRSISGSLALEYTNSSKVPFRPVPSAYDFGGDTGETSTGIAVTWTTAHTAMISQGPAMLYGLWGAAPWVSVPEGSIHLAGQIVPSYGFVFVSNTRPVTDPFGTDEQANMSWLPTTNSGSFSTYLPPTGGMWTAKYYVQGFAAGSAEKNGTPVTGTDTSYLLKLASAPGTINAPLYMFSNAQAAALAKNVTGSSAVPYTFSGLTVNENFSFEHVNDYGYPDFIIFLASGVTNPIVVNDTYQGADSAAGNFVIIDYAVPGSTGILSPPPYTFGPAPYYTSGIAIYGGTGDEVTDQILASDGYGLQLTLWDDTNVTVEDIASEFGGLGVFVGECWNSEVAYVSATDGAIGVSDIASHGTVVFDTEAFGAGAYDIQAYTAVGNAFFATYAEGGATGIATGANYGAEVDYDPYYYIPGTTDTVIDLLEALNGSTGANVTLSTETEALDIVAYNGSIGIVLFQSPVAVVAGVEVDQGSVGAWLLGTTHTTVVDVSATRESWGVEVVSSRAITVEDVSANNHSYGVAVIGSEYVRIDHVRAIGHSVGVVLESSSHVSISHVFAGPHSIAIEVL